MAELCIGGGLNPSKTLAPKFLSIKPSDPSRFSSSFFCINVGKPKKQLPSLAISASAMSSSQYDIPLSLEPFRNSEHRDELMNVIKSSLSNCLSETHLDSTVPGLKSKTRGKAID